MNFDKVVINRKNNYKCRLCHVVLNSYAMTRDHHCDPPQLSNGSGATPFPPLPMFSPTNMPSPFLAQNQHSTNTPTSRGFNNTPPLLINPQQPEVDLRHLIQPPQQQPQSQSQHWVFQQMMEQERKFREEQMKRQEENYAKQFELLQNNTNQKMNQMEKMVESLTISLRESNQRRDSTDDRRLESNCNEKKVRCPRWMKNEPLKNFLSDLSIWDKCHKSKGKYLEVVEALQESNRAAEKLRVELEVRNGLLDPCDDNIVDRVITKLKEWFGKTVMDESYDKWEVFSNILRNIDEDVDTFVVRYETVISEMNCAGVEVNDRIKALQLIKSINVDENQRRCILTNMNKANMDNIYVETKSSIRLLKGSLVERKAEAKEQEVFYGESRSRDRNKSTYTQQNERSKKSGNSGNNRWKDSSRERSRGRSSSRGSHKSPHERKKDNHRRSSKSFEDVNVCIDNTIENSSVVLMALCEQITKMILDTACF